MPRTHKKTYDLTRKVINSFSREVGEKKMWINMMRKTPGRTASTCTCHTLLIKTQHKHSWHSFHFHCINSRSLAQFMFPKTALCQWWVHLLCCQRYCICVCVCVSAREEKKTRRGNPFRRKKLVCMVWSKYYYAVHWVAASAEQLYLSVHEHIELVFNDIANVFKLTIGIQAVLNFG